MDLALVELPKRFLKALERARHYHMPLQRCAANPNSDCSSSAEELTPGELPRQARQFEYPAAIMALSHTVHGAEIFRDTGCHQFGDTQGCEGLHPGDVREMADRTKGPTPLAKTTRMYWHRKYREVVQDIHHRCGSYKNTAQHRFVSVHCLRARPDTGIGWLVRANVVWHWLYAHTVQTVCASGVALHCMRTHCTCIGLYAHTVECWPACTEVRPDCLSINTPHACA